MFRGQGFWCWNWTRVVIIEAYEPRITPFLWLAGERHHLIVLGSPVPGDLQNPSLIVWCHLTLPGDLQQLGSQLWTQLTRQFQPYKKWDPLLLGEAWPTSIQWKQLYFIMSDSLETTPTSSWPWRLWGKRLNSTLKHVSALGLLQVH